MNKIDLIINALQNCSAFQPKNYYEIDKALAAARELKALAQPEQTPDAWRNAAIRLGEDLYSVGPDGYYDMTAKQWLDWALGVVNTAPPRKPWVGLTDEEIKGILDCGRGGLVDIKKAEQILKEKNGG